MISIRILCWLACSSVSVGSLRVSSHALVTTNQSKKRSTSASDISELTVASGKRQESGAIVLTILTLVGVYMGLAARAVEANAIIKRDSAFDRAGAVMRDVRRSYNFFSSFFDALKADLEEMPAHWSERHGKSINLEDVIKLVPLPEVNGSSINPLAGIDAEDIVKKDVQAQAESIGFTLVGLSSPVVGTFTSVFGFVLSLHSLSKAIWSHHLTSEDSGYVAQTSMFQMMLRAQEANAYGQFCSFIKVTWEQAMMVQSMPEEDSMDSQSHEFNQEKARHIAGEMQRMWRCHCLDKVDHEGCVDCYTSDREYYRPDDVISLQLVYDNRQGYALFSPGDTEGVRLLVNRFRKREYPNRRFVTDIQVVYRQCPKPNSCTGRCKKPDTSYEDNLQKQGYKLLAPELLPSAMAERLAKRSKDCLAVAKNSKKDNTTRVADIQQLSGWRGHSVVLVYVKESEGVNDIPIHMLKVVYGQDSANEHVRNGWTLLPLPLYHNTYWSSRLNAQREQPFVVFIRKHAVVPCPRLAPELKKAHDCCKVPKPNNNRVNTLGDRWCEYKPWLRKAPSRIEGYESAIRYVFPDLSKKVAHSTNIEYCANTVNVSTSGYSEADKRMWLEGCQDGMWQIVSNCRKMDDEYWIDDGPFKNSACTGRAFLEHGDPMWRDPRDHSQGRKGDLRVNLILAANVYGSAGLRPTCDAREVL